MNVFKRVKKHCECNDVDSDSEKEDADKNNEEAGTNTQVATDARMLDNGDGDSYGESDDEEDKVG